MKTHKMPSQKRIALVAHDGRKDDLLSWVEFNRTTLSGHFLCSTGTTGKMISEETGLPINRFLSGPLGGDLQIGSGIAEGDIDILIFFWDPLEPQPHDPDIKALLRIAVLYNIPVASNRATADFLVSSPLMKENYKQQLPDYAERLQQSYDEQDLFDED